MACKHQWHLIGDIYRVKAEYKDQYEKDLAEARAKDEAEDKEFQEIVFENKNKAWWELTRNLPWPRSFSHESTVYVPQEHGKKFICADCEKVKEIWYDSD